MINSFKISNIDKMSNMDTLQFVLELVDSSTVKLLIVGIAIIAIVALLRTRLSTSPGNPTSLRDIHSYYICGILLLLLIQLGAYIVVEADPKGQILIQYISFASTLSSLILSVLAIIYTLVSNSKGDTHIAKLESASTKLTTSADEFAKQIKSLETITSSIHEFKSVASKLKDDLRDAVGQKIDEMGSNLQKTQYEYLQQMMGNREVGSSNFGTNSNLPGFKEYLEQGSLLGVFSIYALLFANERGVHRISVDVFAPYGNYCCGYLIATDTVYSLGISVEVYGEGKIDILCQGMTTDSPFSICEDVLQQRITILEDKEQKDWNNKLSEVKSKIEDLSKQK